MDVGKKLKIARETIGYTLEKVSALTHIGASSISEFENSKRAPKLWQLSKLAEVYRRNMDFFFSDELHIADVLLWRDPPREEEAKEVEAQFRQLCEQYHNLEVWTGEKEEAALPYASTPDASRFSYEDAKSLALNVQRGFGLGDIPSVALKHTLDEKYYVKIFYLDFEASGNAISTVSEGFGPAILLNASNKLWRRNYDLGHELFHILTWGIFRTGNSTERQASKREETLADVFASTLLLPETPLRNRIRAASDEKKEILFDSLDDIARECGVSVEALLWRIHNIYGMNKSDTERYVEVAKRMQRKPRPSDSPDELPDRYWALAQRALKEGKMSLMQFAKYTRISYREAEKYLTEEELNDEEISIPIA